MRCKHKKFTLSEYVSVVTGFHFEDGIPPEDGVGWHTDAVPTGQVGVRCEDCSFSKQYSSIGKSPRWVQEAWECLMDEQDRHVMRRYNEYRKDINNEKN
jgi:hypothetical protein